MNKKQYEVIILGTGPAGLQAAIHAARTKVSVLVLGRQPKSSLFKAHIENYCCLPGVTGESLLVEGLVLDDGSSLKVVSVFIELGAKGAIELAGKLGVLLDSESLQYIVTDKNQETNLPGIYAAGDICRPPWQIADEGCVAGLQAAAFAKKHR